MESFELALTSFKKAENALKRAQDAYDKASKPDDITRARKMLESAEAQAVDAYDQLEKLRSEYWVERYKRVKAELFEKAGPLMDEAVLCCKNSNVGGLRGLSNRLEVIRELLHQPPFSVDLQSDIPDSPLPSDAMGRI
jgi:hypothetical protein